MNEYGPDHDYEVTNPEEVAQAVVTAYLNSIKHEFDENNPDTWPKKDGPILLFRKDQAHCVVYIPKEALSRMDLFGLKNGDVWVYIADIMPEENKL